MLLQLAVSVFFVVLKFLRFLLFFAVFDAKIIIIYSEQVSIEVMFIETLNGNLCSFFPKSKAVKQLLCFNWFRLTLLTKLWEGYSPYPIETRHNNT